MKLARWSVALVSISMLVGCGGVTTRTVTTTVATTVTETEQASSTDAPGATSPTDFCDSATGDALTQADSQAGKAFNDASTSAMEKAEATIFRLARKAPAGAPCAVDALHTLRFNWNNGAQNFHRGGP